MTHRTTPLIALWLVVASSLGAVGCKLNRSGVALADGGDTNAVPDAAAVLPDAPTMMADASETIDAMDNPGSDAEPDADVPVTFEYIPSNFNPDGMEPLGDVLLDCGLVMFDSSTGLPDMWCDSMPTVVLADPAAPPEMPVIVVTGDFEITSMSTLMITGERPVIFAVFGNATINGTLDVSASEMTDGPGGALLSICGDGTLTTSAQGGRGGNGISTGEGGGGGGGGFGSDGGHGGVGADDTGMGGRSGALIDNILLKPLHGGCAGGGGGTGPGTGNTGGEGGRAGGAVQISATGAIFVDGLIAAAGTGGQGGTLRDGGGGGGSGGGILLESIEIHLMTTARITANGGGGGQGGNALIAPNENNSGSDGAKDSDIPSEGGSTTVSLGGDGGNGGAGSQGPGNGDAGIDSPLLDADGGGGGGGGGVGRIRINALGAPDLMTGALMSPPPTIGTIVIISPPENP